VIKPSAPSLQRLSTILSSAEDVAVNSINLRSIQLPMPTHKISGGDVAGKESVAFFIAHKAGTICEAPI